MGGALDCVEQPPELPTIVVGPGNIESDRAPALPGPLQNARAERLRGCARIPKERRPEKGTSLLFRMLVALDHPHQAIQDVVPDPASTRLCAQKCFSSLPHLLHQIVHVTGINR